MPEKYLQYLCGQGSTVKNFVELSNLWKKLFRGAFLSPKKDIETKGEKD